MAGDDLTSVFYALYGIAFTIQMLAFLMTSMQKLRMLIAFSSLCYVTYYYFFPAEPLWLDVGAEVMLICINLFMLVYQAWVNSRISFDQRESFLYQSEFSDLTRIEFNRLLKISEWHLEGPGFVYTVAGSPVKDIYYLISGRAEAEMPDGSKVGFPRGNVIGEVSYRLRSPASATVTSTEACMCLRWDQERLRELCERSTNIKRAVDNVLSSHMARKLSEKSDQRPDLEDPVIEAG